MGHPGVFFLFSVNLGGLGVLEICATGNCRPVSVFRQSTLVEAG
jgi:hypothetical protein